MPPPENKFYNFFEDGAEVSELSSQLFYQIVVHGRNELGLAPDEYAGFTMTLLRMLAFAPLQASADTKAPPAQAAASSRPAAAAVAKASFLTPLDMIKVPVTKRAMVIGGGVAGINAALDLAEQNIPVTLVEKEPTIGGVMAQLNKTFPTMDCSI